jgi:hypothetical protein
LNHLSLRLHVMNGLERFEQSPVMMIEQQQHMIEQ